MPPFTKAVKVTGSPGLAGFGEESQETCKSLGVGVGVGAGAELDSG